MELKKEDENDCPRKHNNSHGSQQDVNMNYRNSGGIFLGGLHKNVNM